MPPKTRKSKYSSEAERRAAKKEQNKKYRMKVKGMINHCKHCSGYEHAHKNKNKDELHLL